MTRVCEEGYCSVVMMDGSGVYRLPRSEYARVRMLWMSGTHAFIETVGFYGAPTTIKAARIEGISDWSPESLAAETADVALQKAEDVVSGE